MTSNEIRLAMAQILEPQHKWEIFDDVFINAPQPYKQLVGYRYPAHTGWILAKDYPNDLAATRAAVLTLSATPFKNKDGFWWSQRDEFLRQLEIIVFRDTGNTDGRIQFDLVNYTARQGDEAFLRTLEKWIPL